ncbi:hypothetical protein DLR11_08030 [Salmonella enterica subsp. salamae]|uniref:Uncharacterized protein n=2 Tax=Salmonella enterica TaxID=28901 RepID=A0A379QJT3_SALER|nr:hypothetical protein LFZ47_12645 [Salmonella enterica subsp. salamae serovar 55:k:z39 str. 1315K]ECG1248762.1 hypothetical protein [Salmonella enterica subsp. salamae]SUF57468.1 Uncharacterised protein [Salmonella enterica]ECG1475746.1 hypothetical protein [Salmonella enterica subsp. salamae]ECI3451788.1 hypothetical protein [Salmonella enterica subsp. salamae]
MVDTDEKNSEISGFIKSNIIMPLNNLFLVSHKIKNLSICGIEYILTQGIAKRIDIARIPFNDFVYIFSGK